MLKRYLVVFTILTGVIVFLGLLSCKKVVVNGKVHQYQTNPLIINGRPLAKMCGTVVGGKIYDYLLIIISPNSITKEFETQTMSAESKPTLLLETKPIFSKTESMPESILTETKRMVETLPETKPASGW